MEQTTTITNILREYPNTIICVRAEDLTLFARQVVAEVRQEFEREQEVKEKESANGKELLDAEDVKAILGISDSTLYRFGKSGLLVPVWIGGQRRYRQTEVERFIGRK